MAAKKAAVPATRDYVIPVGKEWGPPCPGSVGSAVNLNDVENQVKENENAFRENRKAQALAIPCPFCSYYHLEMQSPVASLIGGEATKDFIDNGVVPVESPPIDEVVLAAAVEAVHNPSNLPPVEEDEEDDESSVNDLINEVNSGDESDTSSDS